MTPSGGRRSTPPSRDPAATENENKKRIIGADMFVRPVAAPISESAASVSIAEAPNPIVSLLSWSPALPNFWSLIPMAFHLEMQ
jgi:hypothetical protein